MPHIVIEYSENIIEGSINSTHLKEINSLLVKIGPFQLKDIKSRAVKHSTYCVAEGGEEIAFIHLQLAILPGRSIEIKRMVNEQLLQYLKENFSLSLQMLKCSFTVEIRELDKDSYVKYTSGAI